MSIRTRHRMRFGETVTLPEPLTDARVDTEGFPTYD